MKNKKSTNCETCQNYVWDDEAGESVCLANLDEDEYLMFLKSSYEACPFYQLYDEYKTVRRQN
jgi:hypothetical protein